MAKKGIAVRIAIGKVKPPGDLGSPSGIEGGGGGVATKRPNPFAKRYPPNDEPDEDDSDSYPDAQEEDDNDEDDQQGGGGAGAVAPTPESVHYHDDAQRCELCSHFGQDSHCEVLQQPVQAEGGCSAFEAMNDQQGGPEMDMGGGGMGDMGGGSQMPYGG